MAQRTILIATPYFHPRIGGLENYAHAIAQGLATGGYRVIVVCGDHVPAVRKQTQDNLTIYRLPIWKVVSNTPINPMWFIYLRHIIKAEMPDVINAHTPVPFMVDMAALASGRIPFVVTYHAATLFKPSNPLLRLITSSYLPVQALTLSRARSIIAVSDYVKQCLPPRLRSKTVVVSNATNIMPSGPTGDRSGLVFVANLSPSHAWKGLDLILGSLSLIQLGGQAAPHLTVIGDGSHRKHYQTLARELGISQLVTFTGRLTGTSRDEQMSRAAALIAYPTTANDAFPTVFLEAWALGLPVIAAAIGSIPSLIDHDTNGILVPPGDPKALAKGIVSLLADPDKTASMGKCGRDMVELEYNWPTQVAKTDQMLGALK